jgi:hypothetical protein
MGELGDSASDGWAGGWVKRFSIKINDEHENISG